MSLKIRFILFFALAPNANASGTSIGNGGDPIFYFLESTRYSMRQTIEYLKNDHYNSNDICAYVEGLTALQRSDCEKFALQALSQIAELNSPQAPIAFVLRENSLIVEGPDGLPMPVAARTSLGKEGVIEFHRSSIEFLSPAIMLSLMIHEFGHKIQFNGAYIQDNLAVMNFPRGRNLLDAFGKAISYWAANKGYIGSNFTLRDLFDCEINSSAGKFRVRVSSPRRFKGHNYERYEITMGEVPSDPRIEVPELSGDALLLRLRIAESQSCLAANSERKSYLEVIRLIANSSNIELVAKKEFLGFNPICDQSKHSLSIEAGGFRFSCLYVGSEGVTINSRSRLQSR